MLNSRLRGELVEVLVCEAVHNNLTTVTGEWVEGRMILVDELLERVVQPVMEAHHNSAGARTAQLNAELQWLNHERLAEKVSRIATARAERKAAK